MEILKPRYKLKGDSFGEPDQYLGANVGKYQLNDGHEYWSTSVKDYIKQSCNLAYGWIVEDGRRWTKRKVAMTASYQPEIDISDELGDELATRFQQMIGILQW